MSGCVLRGTDVIPPPQWQITRLLSATPPSVTTMPLQTTCDLSVLELLRLLNEKLGLRCTRLRETRISPAISAASLEPEVSHLRRFVVSRSQSIPQIESLERGARDVLELIPSLRNLLQPVNRLPPEILSHVARYVPDENAKDTRPILPLTHVCRYWRESIISTPGIWTSISSGSKGLTALNLERSKAAPLEIELNMRIRDRGFFDILLPHIKNAGSLSVHGFSSVEELTQVLPNFPRSTPNLRSLTLRAAYTKTERNQSIAVFESLTSTLRYLSLNHFHLYPSFLHLRSLTELELSNFRLNLPLDTLLNFLKENRSLETATLSIGFAEPSLRSSRLATAIENRLRCLSIRCDEALDGRALVSSIVLQRGARLEIDHRSSNATLSGILSGVPATNLSNLSSPTFMECQSYCRLIRLLGPHGVFSFKCLHGPEDPFAEFPLLPLTLTTIREFRLVHRRSERALSPLKPTVFQPSFFPALETLAVNCETSVSYLFSVLFSNPSSPPSLKTLAFFDCNLTEDFMEELMRFASSRKNTTSARLHRVVIVNSKGKLPGFASIDALGKHVPVVDVRMSKELPKDLT